MGSSGIMETPFVIETFIQIPRNLPGPAGQLKNWNLPIPSQNRIFDSLMEFITMTGG
ncbi:MAG: hypothetical protein ACM3JQ_05370 [Candidatus Eiseniibacteriota bacterium]